MQRLGWLHFSSMRARCAWMEACVNVLSHSLLSLSPSNVSFWTFGSLIKTLRLWPIIFFFFRIKSMSNLDFFFFPSNFQLRWPVVVERSFFSFSFSFLVFSLRNFIDIHKEICINYEISREEWRKTSNQTIIKKFFS